MKTKIYNPQLHTQKWGFNELDRRLKDLCNFVNRSCNWAVLDAIDGLSYMPLPLHSH